MFNGLETESLWTSSGVSEPQRTPCMISEYTVVSMMTLTSNPTSGAKTDQYVLVTGVEK